MFLLFMYSLFSCDSPNGSSAEFNSSDLSSVIASLTEKNMLNEEPKSPLDSLLRQEIDKQLRIDSRRYILKISVKDKNLIVFPTQYSQRLDHFIYTLKDSEAVKVGLKEQFDNHFYQSHFNTKWDLSKFYFEKSLPEDELNRFLDMCVLSNYEIISLN